MAYYIPDRVMSDITAFAKKHDIEKIVLFGSRARGTHSDRSDIDLAVSGGDFDAFYWEAKENTHSLLMLDILDMDLGVSEELQHEIAKDGVVIYEKT